MNTLRISGKQLITYIAPLCAMFFISAANAHLQIIYTSKHLPMTESLADGYDDGNLDPNSNPSLKINLSILDGTSANSSIPLILENARLDIAHPGEGYIATNNYFLPESNGYVTMDSSGNISGWNFSLALKPIIPPDASNAQKYMLELEDNLLLIESAYGTGTCNCDFFNIGFYATYYWERDDRYTRLARLEKLYRDSNHPDQWQIIRADVPEPSGILVVFGLGALIVRRLIKTKMHV